MNTSPPLRHSLNDGMAGSVAHVSSPWSPLLVVILVALLAANAPVLVSAGDMMAAGRPLSGDRKLVSRGGKFALGFFKPAEEGAVDRWYVGIWYHKIPVRTPVWVANRDRPVSDPAASRLTIAPDGNLVMLDPSGSSAWSTNASARSFANVVVAVLLDTGNLVLAPSSNASDVLWQSFDHVGDTWLPGAKVRRDKVTGLFHGMTSWKSYGDPALGAYTLQLDPTGAPRYMLLRKRNGTLAYYTGIGDWNGLTFPGDAGYSFSFVDNDRDSYFAYGFVDNSIMYRFVMDVFGQVKGLVWVEDTQAWNQVFAVPMRQCDVPQRCGAFGVCTEGAPTVCRCLEGFSPRDVAGWSLGDYSGGCVRNTELQCGDSADRLKEKDSFFLMYYHVSRRLPDNGDRGVAAGASSSGDCEQACRVDCACSAYAYKRNCILWQNDLLNLEDTYFKREADVGDLYIRLATSSEPPVPGVRNYKRRTDEITVGAFAIVCLVVVTSVIIVGTTMSRRRAKKVQCLEGCVASFTYRELKSFTNKFSDKLGGGAFGSVFRGQLPDRTTTIAVKKLEGLRQGEKQFRAEVSTLGTIHHVNLIRLLGFCSGSGDRNKLLVYEYMSNGSLDRHLFGATPHALSWRTRYQVAVGVAKGLCYLHDKCRDCIIHCDVKPENVLLDVEFEPKIADFGLAKLMGRDFSRVLTTMRGTIGYLAPEWMGGEAITVKADVYSYGMMLFEIVSGKRNVESGPDPSSSGGGTSSNHHAASEFFPVLVARSLAAAEGDVTALLDSALGGDADIEEVRRVCKVACWCIQDEADARPTMAEVVRVLQGVTKIDVSPVPRYLQILAGRWMHTTHDYSS